MRDVAEGNGHVDDAGRTAAWIVIMIIAVIGIVVLEEGTPEPNACVRRSYCNADFFQIPFNNGQPPVMTDMQSE